MGSRLPRQQEWMAGCQGRVLGPALAVTPPEKSFWMSSWASIDLSSLCPLALSQTGLMSQTLIEFKAAFFLPPDRDFYLVSHHTNSNSRRQRPSHFLGRPSTQASVMTADLADKSATRGLMSASTRSNFAIRTVIVYQATVIYMVMDIVTTASASVTPMKIARKPVKVHCIGYTHQFQQ
ncbi:hypothetical protein DdX_15963 [Ditylenchus destructor]|uniref:Uncharacterized protein n=1 Tax=Ditylenchus destructor TaxID=166010 RepID=A0AAD4QX68_9BILA|nr:hypothetical protein DdX_15963 [Ditylenchus destructor]